MKINRRSLLLKEFTHMNEPTVTTPSQSTSLKQRHGCLTAYLVLMIIASSAMALIYLVGAEAIRQNVPNVPDWAFPVLTLGEIINLVCAVALFRWKKWGFWGFIGSAAIVFFVTLSIAPGSELGGLLGVAILYGVLHIGKERKGWSQLE